MTQEDKELLLKDLCARLPYGVVCRVKYILNNETTYGEDVEKECTDIVKRINFDNYTVYTEWLGYESDIEDIKPYLRPMSSMTEEEIYSIDRIYTHLDENCLSDREFATDLIDYYNLNHFDYRGLIEKGLAIAVTNENNPYK